MQTITERLEAFRTRTMEKRQVVEQARSQQARRLTSDLRRIVNREMDFTRRLVADIIPVRVHVDKEAMDSLRARCESSFPIRIEWEAKETAAAAAAPVAETTDPLAPTEKKEN